MVPYRRYPSRLRFQVPICRTKINYAPYPNRYQFS